jgi:hypothetical protein
MEPFEKARYARFGRSSHSDIVVEGLRPCEQFIRNAAKGPYMSALLLNMHTETVPPSTNSGAR